ncbi:MAG: hypothetical protein CFE45_38830 [Burkholderiales bacterium PBB5]|nr:MAG: hypothetical protein CFE45_38830 [Burkholderiales bacterium PBB5]
MCPTRFFSGDPIYREAQAPDKAQIQQRLQAYWRPYHAALAGELARLRAAHGHAVLWDGHSIRSQLPWLFDGKLPDLNLGTASGTSCDATLRSALMAVLASQDDFTHIADGRFTVLDPARVQRIQPLLRNLLQTCLDWKPGA